MICSNCLHNEGLRIEAELLGIKDNLPCQRCNSIIGSKLDKGKIQILIDRFFRKGSIENDYHLPIYQLSMIKDDEVIPFRLDIRDDLLLLKEESGYCVSYTSPPLIDLGITEISERIEKIENDAKNQMNLIIDELFDKFTVKPIDPGLKVFRIRKNPKEPNKDAEYDSPPKEFIVEGRLNDLDTSIFYCSNNIETCIHEIKGTVYDNLFLATYEVIQPLNILSLLDYRNDLTFDERENHLAYIAYLFRTDLNYRICHLLARRAKDRKFDGVEYYSFFSKVMNDRKSSLAIFGYPLREKILRLNSINKVRIEKIDYKLNFGPVE